MIDAIAVLSNEGREGIDARELHRAIGSGRDFTTWIREQIDRFGLIEGQDYHLTKSGEVVERVQGGGSPRDSYVLALHVAKVLAVGQNSAAARAARARLVEIEAAWNSPTAVMARGLQMAHAELARLHSENVLLAPKASVYDACMSSGDALTVGKAAQVVARRRPMGEVRLFRFLRAIGLLQRDNRPYQRYIEAGYFVVRETPIVIEGSTHIHVQPLVTQKGLEYIERRLAEADAQRLLSLPPGGDRLLSH